MILDDKEIVSNVRGIATENNLDDDDNIEDVSGDFSNNISPILASHYITEVENFLKYDSQTSKLHLWYISELKILIKEICSEIHNEVPSEDRIVTYRSLESGSSITINRKKNRFHLIRIFSFFYCFCLILFWTI